MTTTYTYSGHTYLLSNAATWTEAQAIMDGHFN